MKAYFKRLSAKISTPQITENQLTAYRNALLAELIKLGASDNELDLVCDNMVVNSIINNRKVEDVAWAILQ